MHNAPKKDIRKTVSLNKSQVPRIKIFGGSNSFPARFFRNIPSNLKLA
jgi:hypothetical protein